MPQTLYEASTAKLQLHARPEVHVKSQLKFEQLKASCNPMHADLHTACPDCIITSAVLILYVVVNMLCNPERALGDVKMLRQS